MICCFPGSSPSRFERRADTGDEVGPRINKYLHVPTERGIVHANIFHISSPVKGQTAYDSSEKSFELFFNLQGDRVLHHYIVTSKSQSVWLINPEGGEPCHPLIEPLRPLYFDPNLGSCSHFLTA